MSDKLFECDKCDKKYGSENGLKQHIINDYPEKKNDNESIEDEPEKQFNIEEFRNRYRLICTICEELFKNPSDFVKHKKTYHEGEHIRSCFYPEGWKLYKQDLINKQEKEESTKTKNIKSSNCECKKEIKELKEVVKVLTTKGYI